MTVGGIREERTHGFERNQVHAGKRKLEIRAKSHKGYVQRVFFRRHRKTCGIYNEWSYPTV